MVIGAHKSSNDEIG